MNLVVSSCQYSRVYAPFSSRLSLYLNKKIINSMMAGYLQYPRRQWEAVTMNIGRMSSGACKDPIPILFSGVYENDRMIIIEWT